MDPRSLSNVLFYIAKLAWPTFLSTLSSTIPIVKKNQNQIFIQNQNRILYQNDDVDEDQINHKIKNKIENENQNLISSTPVSTMRKAFLHKCSFMLGQGEFVNALWAWVQVQKSIFFHSNQFF